jgi:hypothetical protein
LNACFDEAYNQEICAILKLSMAPLQVGRWVRIFVRTSKVLNDWDEIRWLVFANQCCSRAVLPNRGYD